MLCDFHIHTGFSDDSDTPPALQIERAIALGMERICITDHHDYDVVSQIDFTLDFPAYLSAMTQLRRQYRDRIRVEIGVELGLQRHIAGYLNELTRTYELDYIIGSRHFIDGLDPYYPAFYEGRTLKEALRRFFEVSLKTVQALDCFDSFGHLDYIVRYFPEKNTNYRPACYADYIDPLLQTLIQKGKALECNTGGFRYRLGHPNPREEILRRYRELGGELITVGSDAHTPDYVGIEFDRTAQLLRECGFRYYTVYHRRKAEMLPL